MSANHENMETTKRKGNRKVKKISKIITVSAVVAVLGFGANTLFASTIKVQEKESEQ